MSLSELIIEVAGFPVILEVLLRQGIGKLILVLEKDMISQLKIYKIKERLSMISRNLGLLRMSLSKVKRRALKRTTHSILHLKHTTK